MNFEDVLDLKRLKLGNSDFRLDKEKEDKILRK